MQSVLEQYNDEKDNAPSLDVSWSGWPLEFDHYDRRAQIRDAGFDPDH